MSRFVDDGVNARKDERTPALRPRLLALAQWVQDAECVADIGCDHGKLAVYLLLSGSTRRVIAVDVSAPSLQKARDLSLMLDLSECMETRLGDGLNVLRPGEADVLVMAGMGGRLIARLLAEHEEVARSARAMLLQPMQQEGELRHYLRGAGLGIEHEKLLSENGRVYTMMRVTPVAVDYTAELPCAWLDEIGPVLWRERDPLLRGKLEAQRVCAVKHLALASRGRSECALARQWSLIQEIEMLDQALGIF